MRIYTFLFGLIAAVAAAPSGAVSVSCTGHSNGDVLVCDGAGAADWAPQSGEGGSPSIIPLVWRVTNNVSPLSAGQADLGCFRVKDAITITSVSATLVTAGSTGSVMTIDINDDGVSIMDPNKLDIQFGATSDDDTASISAGSIAANSLLCADIDSVSTGSTELGVTITLE